MKTPMSQAPIFPLLYAAPISYYAKYLQDTGCFDKYEPFVKQSFRNRARVYGANGIITLSIPITGESSKLSVEKVCISNTEPWQRNHWKTLESAYKSSPFFEFYSHLIKPLYEKSYTSLWEYNLAFHQVVLKCLDVKLAPCFTENMHAITTTDLRAVYTSKKSIPLTKPYPVYQQVFSYSGKFESDLSILDGIFNLGPELENYLLSLSVK